MKGDTTNEQERRERKGKETRDRNVKNLLQAKATTKETRHKRGEFTKKSQAKEKRQQKKVTRQSKRGTTHEGK